MADVERDGFALYASGIARQRLEWEEGFTSEAGAARPLP